MHAHLAQLLLCQSKDTVVLLCLSFSTSPAQFLVASVLALIQNLLANA